jgi:hypothetical protein
VKETSQGHVQKGLQECLHQPLYYLLTVCLLLYQFFFSYEHLENTEKDPDDPVPADGDTQLDISSY